MGQSVLNGRVFNNSVFIGDEINDMFMDKASDTCRLADYAVGLAVINLAIVKLHFLVSNVELIVPQGMSSEQFFFQKKEDSRYKYFSDETLNWTQLCELITDDMTAYLNVDARSADGSTIGDKALDRRTMLSMSAYAVENGKAHLQKYIDSAFLARFKFTQNVQYTVNQKKLSYRILALENLATIAVGVTAYINSWS